MCFPLQREVKTQRGLPRVEGQRLHLFLDGTLTWPCFLFGLPVGLSRYDSFWALLPREPTPGCSLQGPVGRVPLGLLVQPLGSPVCPSNHGPSEPPALVGRMTQAALASLGNQTERGSPKQQ